MAITWRNIDPPRFNEAAELMRGAAQGITGGVDQLVQVLQNRNKAIHDANSEAYRNALARYHTIDDLENARKQGEFDRLAESFGNRVDQNLIRTGYDQRLQELRNQARSDSEFTDWERNQAERPFMDNFLARIQGMDRTSEDALYASSQAINKDLEEALARDEISGSAATKLREQLFRQESLFEQDIRGDRTAAQSQEAHERGQSAIKRQEQRDDLARDLLARNARLPYENRLSDTEMRMSLQQSLEQMGQPLEEIQQFIDGTFEPMLARRLETAAGDVNRQNRAMTELRTKYGIDESNPWFNLENLDLTKEAARIVDIARKEGGALDKYDDTKRANIIKKINRLLTQGVSVIDPSTGRRTHVRVPPAIVEMATHGIKDVAWGFDGDLNTVVTNLLLDNPQLLEQAKNYENYRKEVANLQRLFIEQSQGELARDPLYENLIMRLQREL